MRIISQLRNIVWGTPTLALLLVTGVYFSIKSGFFMPRAIWHTARDTVFSLRKNNSDGISPFAAVATALGGTVGVGSIVGVGYAISVGGAGSIFWMWVCSFFGMGLKYAEVRVALNTKGNKKMPGGAPSRLYELGYKKTALLFCLVCIAVSFGTGNLTQISAANGFFDYLGIDRLASAALIVLIVALSVFGGRRRISAINSLLVPVASLVYIAVCAVFLFKNSVCILPSLRLITSEAFGLSAVGGGFSGALLAHTVREGFSKSLFSNEAGMGSSPLAYATVNAADITAQAKWGIFEIFFDSFVVSTLTALALLVCDKNDVAYVFADVMGVGGKAVFLSLCAVFAFASILSWCYYAECCIDFAFKNTKRAKRIYHTFFSLCAMLGVYLSAEVIWEVSDILNAMMVFPNLFLLYKCRNEIERI